MLIQNYGLFWRREHVFWGKGNNPGTLKGVLATARTAVPIDFRGQQGVYCLYDDSFRLVYVGQAGSQEEARLFTRLKKHRKDRLADRWSKFSWFGIRGVKRNGELKVESFASLTPMREALDHIEAILIEAVEPPHNRQGGKFGKRVGRYLQYRDVDSLGPNAPEMIRDLWENS